jgi:hypothetical protein
MKLSFVSLFAVVLATTLSAQAPQDGDKVTVAGCLQRAQRTGSVGGTVVGTSASPNTAADEANSSALVDAYLLSQATPVVGGAPQATGTSGTAQITTFGLSGREAELERHLGARLQVTGKVVPPATSGRGAGGAATATGVKRIEVESFKILAEKCEGNQP